MFKLPSVIAFIDSSSRIFLILYHKSVINQVAQFTTIHSSAQVELVSRDACAFQGMGNYLLPVQWNQMKHFDIVERLNLHVGLEYCIGKSDCT